jgi:hypothetical protein
MYRNIHFIYAMVNWMLLVSVISVHYHTVYLHYRKRIIWLSIKTFFLNTMEGLRGWELREKEREREYSDSHWICFDILQMRSVNKMFYTNRISCPYLYIFIISIILHMYFKVKILSFFPYMPHFFVCPHVSYFSHAFCHMKLNHLFRVLIVKEFLSF